MWHDICNTWPYICNVWPYKSGCRDCWGVDCMSAMYADVACVCWMSGNRWEKMWHDICKVWPHICKVWPYICTTLSDVIHMCHVSHSYALHNSIIRLTFATCVLTFAWLSRMCDMSFICVMCLIHMYVTWLNHMSDICNACPYICNVWPYMSDHAFAQLSQMCDMSFICVMYLIQMCNMTQS